MAFAPDGKTLASGGDDRQVRFWDVGGKTLKSIVEGHTGRVRCVAYAPDRDVFASGGEDRAVWVGDGKNMAVLKGHTGTVTGVAFAKDGKRLASAGEDRAVRLWDLVKAAK